VPVAGEEATDEDEVPRQPREGPSAPLRVVTGTRLDRAGVRDTEVDERRRS